MNLTQQPSAQIDSVRSRMMPPNGKGRVLVVDDDTAVSEWIRKALLKHGFQSVAAETALQGLIAVQSDGSPVNLAIVDMLLPGTPGLDLAADMARHRPDLRVLYISGCVDSLAMTAIFTSSPEAVLLKPFTEEKLIERVQRLLAKPVHQVYGRTGC